MTHLHYYSDKLICYYMTHLHYYSIEIRTGTAVMITRCGRQEKCDRMEVRGQKELGKTWHFPLERE